jgi:hypothetical protein
VVQLIGLIAVAGTIAALWSAWVTIQGRRGWGAGIQSIVVALALVYLIWFSFAFKLFSISLIY